MSYISTQAIKAKIGSTPYYLSKLTANQLTGLVKPAAELEEWESMSIEEKFQRDPNWGRIKKEIAPYLANNADRFYGSLIIIALNGGMVFESVGDLKTDMPAAYKRAAEDIGFLTIEGGTFVALDGQHRLLALRQVVQGLEGGEGEFQNDVPQDEVSVMFIELDNSAKTRNIFTAVNRYAKSTTAGQNYAIDNTDGYAIVNRKLINDIIPDVKINTKGSAIPERSAHLTTLASLYQMTKSLLDEKTDIVFEHQQIQPSSELVEEAWLSIREYYEDIFKNITAFSEAINGDNEKVKELRDANSSYSLLMKPIAQTALVDALCYATQDGLMPFKSAVKKADTLDWNLNSSLWKKVLIKNDGKIDQGKQARKRAAALMTYLIAGNKLNEDKKRALLKDYQLSFFKANRVPEDEAKWHQFPSI